MITSTPLAIVFLLTALFSVTELVRTRGRAEVESYIADREAQATHVLMNGGMAAMFASFYDAAIGRGITVVYGVAIVAILGQLILLVARNRTAITNRVAGSLYHALGLGAMIYAIRLMPAAMPGMSMTGAVHGTPSWLSLLLGGVFLLDGLATAILVGLFPRALVRMERAIDGEASELREYDGATMRAIRRAAVPHCIMDAGMALMLLV